MKKMISILGDSISTFDGFNPQGYLVFYTAEMQARNGLSSVYDTWWAKVNQYMHGYLCVNNSYSGSRVTGSVFPAGVSIERIQNLRMEQYEPDYILIYLGYNDFGNGIQLFSNYEMLGFEDSYNNMLSMIREYYPYTKVVCGTLMRTYIKDNSEWVFPEEYMGVGLEEYNNVIRQAAYDNNCYLVDISRDGARYETLDGSHPTVIGHSQIAERWKYYLSGFDIL